MHVSSRGFLPAILVPLLLSAGPLTADGQLGGNTNVTLHPLPVSKEGAFPVHIPEYRGQVKQLLLLNDRWLVLAVYDLPEIIAKLDELSEGKLLQSEKDWEEGLKKGQKNWVAFKLPSKIHDTLLAPAREALGERQLGDAATFKMISRDDSAYAAAVSPARVTRTYVSLGGRRMPGAYLVDWAHYCILELPAPMRNGSTYAIRVGDRGGVRFTYDEKRTVSRAIKVNQAGYLPDAGEKFAYLGAFACEFGPVDFAHAKTFDVVDVQSGKTVYSGEVRLRERNPRFAPKADAPDDPNRPFMYGEDVYELDLGPLQAEGEFFISIPGVGRSWTFRHAPDAYGEAFYTAARGFFHQRAATALAMPHTAWTRAKSTMHDTIHECGLIGLPPQAEGPKNFERFDVVGATIDRGRVTRDVIGGWYDAADWDRNQTHFVAVFDILNAYEHAPDQFKDGQLNLPESGDGTPDILNEAAWGLECWRRSQDERGGISGFIETNTHPGYDDAEHPFAFSPRTRWSSLCYAAAAAQYARLVKPFDAEQAALYSQSALRAWAFGIDPQNSLGKIEISARRNRGAGDPYTFAWEEKEEYNAPFRVHAALELHRLTGDTAYLENIAEFAKAGCSPFQWRFSHRDYSAWIYAGLAFNAGGALPAEVVEHWRTVYVNEADNLVSQIADMPYRQTWPRSKDYWAGWGASTVANFNRCLFIAWKLTGERKYRDTLIANTDFMLGANPLGMSWTSGIGFVYPIDFQHHNSQKDGIMDPIPGLTVYGINGGPAMHHRGRDYIWQGKGPDGKAVEFIPPANKDVPFYRRWTVHPMENTGQCEFTIHETMSSILFSTSVLLEQPWMPDDALLKRGPRREELLFGYWPMP